MIRAAESGDVKADYILQINLFDTEKKLTLSKDLRHEKAVRQFMRSHPEINTEFENGNSKIHCAVIGAELNAKLIYVKTGEISWIGEHQLNEYSSGIQHLTVEMGARKFVDNAPQLETFVSFQNTAQARQSRYQKMVALPKFSYGNALIKPTVSLGHCDSAWDSTVELRSKLARQVAKELIATIKVQ